MAKFLVLHGPNLNMLGSREPQFYGNSGLEAINNQLATVAKQMQHEVLAVQSNAEHELIDQIQAAKDQNIDVIIFNPAGFTHTSVALRDALLSVGIPFIEVHMSNVHARESFRKQSYFSDIALGVICGFSGNSYVLALQAAHFHMQSKQK